MQKGQWVLGFAKKVGCINILFAKLWGIYQGFSYCLQRGFNIVEIQYDSTIAVALFSSSDNYILVYANNVIHACRAWLSLLQQTTIEVCPRETNAVADVLATYAHANDEYNLLFEFPPMWRLNLLQQHLYSQGLVGKCRV